MFQLLMTIIISSIKEIVVQQQIKESATMNNENYIPSLKVHIKK